MGVSVRIATMKDFDVILEMRKSLFEYEHLFDSNLSNSTECYEHIKNKTDSDFKKGTFFVAERENKIIGYLFAYVEYMNPCITQIKRVYLEELYVSEKFRRTGIGTMLVKKAMLYYKKQNKDWFVVSVYHSNAPSISLWKKLGFEPLIIFFSKKY